MMDEAAANTDQELWREVPGDYYSPSLWVTEGGGIGMAVGGLCFVRPIRKWHGAERRIAALEAELVLRTRERDEWRREHDMVDGIAKRYQVALDHIGNNDDADCSLTEQQRIRIAREAVRGAGYKD